MSVSTAVDEKVDQKFEIVVTYNGVSKKVTVTLNQTIQAVLEHAIHEFGNLPNPHTLALFTEDGRELDLHLHVRDAGIHPGTHLLLRPSAVRGGGAL